MAIKLFVIFVFPCVFVTFLEAVFLENIFLQLLIISLFFLSLSLLKDDVFSQPVSTSIMCVSLHSETRPLSLFLLLTICTCNWAPCRRLVHTPAQIQSAWNTYKEKKAFMWSRSTRVSADQLFNDFLKPWTPLIIVSFSVVDPDPDPHGSSSILVGLIRIQKLVTCLEVLDVLFWGLKSFPVACTSFLEAYGYTNRNLWRKTNRIFFQLENLKIFGHHNPGSGSKLT
jgi:hypothetical protein